MRFAWTPLLLTVINSVHSIANVRKNQAESENGGQKENVFLVYSQPKLMRRHSGDNIPDDNIAMDSENLPVRKLKVKLDINTI